MLKYVSQPHFFSAPSMRIVWIFHILLIICQLVDMWIVSAFWFLWVMLPVKICGDDFFFFFNDCLFAVFSVRGIKVGAGLAATPPLDSCLNHLIQFLRNFIPRSRWLIVFAFMKVICSVVSNYILFYG